jgi:hypothetical protein
MFEDGIRYGKGRHEMATGPAARNEDDGTMAGWNVGSAGRHL